jgi:hypothetical protein
MTLSSRLPAGLSSIALVALLACGGAGGTAPSGAGGTTPSSSPTSAQVQPPSANVAPGEAVQFALASAAAAAIVWSVEETGGGTIDASGHYTAPTIAGTFHVAARSAADPTVAGRATVVVTQGGGPPEPGMGTGTNQPPSYVSVTGGGPMPSLTGAPVAACAGDGSADDTSCLQRAIDSAHQAGKPLLVPATASYYRITAPLTVTTSLIGTGGMPTIRQTSTCSSSSCVGLRLAAGMTGWIYNLHLVGAYTGSRGEYAHNISVGGVNGVTIKGNLLESPLGDCIADNAQESDGSAAARNVLIDGNTMVHSARCMVSMVNVSDRWAIMNNFLDDTTPWVSPIDLEPWQAASSITNVEVGYNRVTAPPNDVETQAGNYIGVVTASGWFDPNPGGNVYAHHNYGSWPFARFVAVTSNAGSFTNVVDVGNVQGSSAP